MTAPALTPTLTVEHLEAGYLTARGEVLAVANVSLSLSQGEALGLVGESGSGKSTLALAILRALPDNARIRAGRVLLGETDLLALPEREMRRYRWRRISMVFQAAMSSLNPVDRVGNQIAEVLAVHLGTGERDARRRVAELLADVGLEPSAAERYPHELSGGMKQRAVIALALACGPDVVIADEPTTALDVIVQRQVLQHLARLRESAALLYISHDLAVVAELCDRVAVMYAGKIMETAPPSSLLRRPRHHYTAALAASVLRLHGPKQALVSPTGSPPDMLAPPSGCRFHPRCPRASTLCREEEPPLVAHAEGHLAACWHPLQYPDEHPAGERPHGG